MGASWKITNILILCTVARLIKAEKFEEVNSSHCENVEYMPANCLKYGEKYYFLEDIPKTSWLEAQHICRKNNGNLITIESADEMKALSDYLMLKKFDDIEDFAFWTAGSDLANEIYFMSIGNGDVLKYKKWANGEPKKGKHCVGLQAADKEFSMHTIDCDERYSYICELNTKGTMRKNEK